MSQIREDESKYKAVFGIKVSDNIFIMHFRQLKPENCDAKCIPLTTENWFDQLTVKVVKLVFQKNHSNLFMTGPSIEILTLKAEDASIIVGC